MNKLSLVFIHGFACDRDCWSNQIAHFFDNHEIIAPDLAGHGTSASEPAPFSIERYGHQVSQLVRAQESPAAVLIGHSMGVRAALECYGLVPHRVAGIITIDASRTPRERSASFSSIIDGPPYHGNFRKFMHVFFDGALFDGERKGFEQNILENAQNLPRDVGMPLLNSVNDWDRSKFDKAVEAVNVPVLAIQSESASQPAGEEKVDRSRMARKTRWVELLQEHIPDARLVTVQQSGHFPMLEHPRVVNRLIDEFIARLGVGDACDE